LENLENTKSIQQSDTSCSAINDSSRDGCTVHAAVAYHIPPSLINVPLAQRTSANLLLTTATALPLVLVCPKPNDELDTKLQLAARLDPPTTTSYYLSPVVTKSITNLKLTADVRPLDFPRNLKTNLTGFLKPEKRVRGSKQVL
jgi:hypothetical protein